MENEMNNEQEVEKKVQPTPRRRIENLTFWEKIQIVVAFMIIFAFLFLIMYRNSRISESFAEINSIKNKITTLQKENDQLEISIQSSLNLSNVEQSAKELLGMQKLTSSQTINITLPKKDYVETSVEDVIVEEDSFWDIIKQKLKKIF